MLLRMAEFLPSEVAELIKEFPPKRATLEKDFDEEVLDFVSEASFKK